MLSPNATKELADRLEITELTAKFAHLVDTKQIDKVMDLFAEDAVFDESNVDAALGRPQGREAIRAHLDGEIRALVGCFHLTGNHIIEEINEAGARGTCSVYCDALFNNDESIHVVGWYEDRYLRTADGWKFASRIVRLHNVDAGEAVTKATSAIARG